MAEILKGAPVAAAISEELVKEVEELKAKGVEPTLAIVRVGAKENDLAYPRIVLHDKRERSRLAEHIAPLGNHLCRYENLLANLHIRD